MKFYVNPGDGSGGRMTQKITFTKSDTKPITMTADHRGFSVLGLSEPMEPIADTDAAALQIAELLYRCRDESLIAHTFGGTLRGDEPHTADVYPPGRHPRIHIGR